MQHTSLTLDEALNSVIYMSTYMGVTNFEKTVRFLSHPVHVRHFGDDLPATCLSGEKTSLPNHFICLTGTSINCNQVSAQKYK